MKITKELIIESEKKRACSDALEWLKEEPRTVQELYDYDIDWYVWALGNFIQCPIIGDVNAKDNTGSTALIYAANNGNSDCVNRLIKAGADINAKDNDGSTALIYAAGNGYSDCVKRLIKAGANVNAKNNNGWTALMYAASYGYDDCVKILKEAGARE